MRTVIALSAEFFRKFYYWIFASFALANGTVFAANESPINSAEDVVDFFENVLTWMATIFWIVAIMAVFYAAFLYATDGGSGTKVEKAKKQLLYAVIAIAIGLVAYAMPTIIRGFLGGGGTGSTSGVEDPGSDDRR